MYVGSQFKLIISILFLPVLFIFLLAADVDFRKTDTTQEITPLMLAESYAAEEFQLPNETRIKIKSGDTFYSTLINLGIDSVFINKIAADKKVRDFTKFKINDEIFITSVENKFEIKRFDDDFYVDVLTIDDDGYSFEKQKESLERIAYYKEFVITDSLYASGKKAEVPDSVLGDLIYIFGWDIDYAFDIRNGDKVKILYENIYSDGRLIANGDILAADFINKGEKLSVIRFTQRGRKDYYSLDSSNVRKAFLRTPIEFARISSHYNPKRKHPILNTIRAHKGTDYAAKTGTAVKVTGDGVIKNASYSDSYGYHIDVTHFNKYMTRYAHLDGFAKGIKKGAKVEQGQTIGYVGSTGLATGPHLHYEFHINGKPTDPIKVEPPNAQSINSYNKEYFNQLAERRTKLIANLSGI